MAYLSSLDLEDLRRSNLNDHTINQWGCYTEKDPVNISRILGWDKPAVELEGWLVLPYFHADGQQNGFARVKPHRPRKDKDGKSIKYEQPRGVSPCALFTPSAATAVKDPSILLIITEGEKKCWVIYQAGFAAIGLAGIWNWQKPKSDPRELIDDLAQVVWAGRRVAICFDTDDKRNPNVNQARAELARVLTDLGAI